MKFSNVLKFCFEAGIAPRLERKSFFLVSGKALAKKDWEWKTEIGAQKKIPSKMN